jgi:cytochrome c oxidase subunit 3
VHCVREGRLRGALASLGATVLLGCCFLGLKSLEYADHFRHGIAPGPYYSFEELKMEGAELFFALYYLLTGLHALHVIAGLSLMIWVMLRIKRKRLTASRHIELELSGLYWHLVDVVWIFLWPILYLIE